MAGIASHCTAPHARPKAHGLRAALSVLLAVGLGLGSLFVVAPAARAAGETDGDRLAAAAQLLDTQAGLFNEPTGAKVQWAYDFLLAFAAAGDGSAPAEAARAWNLLDTLELRAAINPDDSSLSQLTLSGKHAAAVTSFDEITQVLHVAGLYGEDATTFAGRNLVQALGGFAFNGADPAWYRTTTTGTTRVSTLQQARTVLALSAAHQSEAAELAAASLVSKQIAASGAWPSAYTGTAAQFESTVNAVIALTTEGGSGSMAAAESGARYLIGLQQADGTFTGGTTVALVAQTANALRGIADKTADDLLKASAAAAVEKSATWLRALQVVNESGVDPLYNGAFAASITDRATILAGTFNVVGFGFVSYPNKGLVDNTLRGALGLGRPIAELAFTDAGDRPVVGSVADYTEGPCAAGAGVTIIVDYGTSAANGVQQSAVRCVTGLQRSVWAALRTAGFEVGSDATTTSTTAGPGNKICQLDGVGADCAADGPASSWSLWSAASGASVWKAANANPSSWAPAAGTVVGLRLSGNDVAGVPPALGPSSTDDQTSPVVTFSAGPTGAVTGATSATFSWTLDDPGAATACRLDDGAWIACDARTSSASKQSYTWKGIAYGDHQFSVRATDVWGNFSTAVRTFSLSADTTAPVVKILRNPGPRTSSSSATFTMSIDDSTATVKCRLDSEEPEDWLYCAAPMENGGPATSRAYANLGLGRHVFEYRAIDPYGNTAKAEYDWEVALDAPPVVQITSTQNVYSKTNTSVSVSYLVATASSGETTVSTECRLDGGTWAACATTTPKVNTSATVKFTTALTDGAHVVDVRATTQDADGNLKPSAVASYNWVVDTAAPVVALETPVSGPRNHGSVSWDATDTNPIASYKCVLDGVSSTCTEPFAFSGLGVGTHTLTVTATDTAGNVSAAATTAWDVTRAAGAELATPVLAGATTSSLTVTGSFTAGDLPASVEAELWHDGAIAQTRRVGQADAGSTADLEVRFAGLASAHPYQVRLVATDENGVGAASAPLTVNTAVAPATVAVPTVDQVTPVSATASVLVSAGDLAAQVVAELLKGDAVVATSAAQAVAAGDTRTLVFPFSGLTGSTDYRVRVQVRSSDDARTSSTSAVWRTAAYPPSFTVGTSARSVLAGKTFTLTASGLRAAESYQVQLAGKVVTSGKASSTGKVSTKVTVPSTAAQADTAVRLVGPSADRYGTSSIWVASKKANLRVSVTSTVKKNKTQRITIAGLVPGEKLRIKVTGRSTKSAKANSSGTYSYSFKVGKKKGTKKVTVYGQVTTRTGKSSYKVK